MSTTTTPTAAPPVRPRTGLFVSILQRQAALLALILLLLFGSLRYEGFLGVFNLSALIQNNADYGLIALGMTFVIMTGGIDLSVGSVAALGSVLAAMMSSHGLLPALAVPILAGAAIGFINGWLVAKVNILPFIVTLATLLAVRGLAFLLAHGQNVGVDAGSGFTLIEQGYIGGVPVPAIILVVAFLLGSLALNFTPWGRHVLSIGGGEDASRLMGLNTDRVKISVYVLSGALAGMAGAMLAALTFSGIPSEGVGWELNAIAAVVVGGTLLTGGQGSVGATLSGTLLLGLIFSILNFENGRGTFTFSTYWQQVIRGLFLLLVVLSQSRAFHRR